MKQTTFSSVQTRGQACCSISQLHRQQKLFSDQKPPSTNSTQEAPLADLVTAIEEHFEPKPNIISQRFYFHKQTQLLTKRIAQFITELRQVTHCKFGDTLSDPLCDCFIVGLLSKSIQKRLLTAKTFTFANACDIAKGMEAARTMLKPSRAIEVSIDLVSTSGM